jgi:large subunit ribosomal protein L9
MAKSIKLLLTESVETLGIVGDVVNVRTGYARNFLLPRNLATTPSDELIKSLAAKRAEAEKQVAAQRKVKEELIGKLQGVELELVKSCNDQGHLYGGITQQELAGALKEKGYTVTARVTSASPKRSSASARSRSTSSWRATSTRTSS